jgi:hypothetical protein
VTIEITKRWYSAQKDVKLPEEKKKVFSEQGSCEQLS